MGIYISTLDRKPEHCDECCCYDSDNGDCKAFPFTDSTGVHRFKYVGQDDPWRPFWCPLQSDEEMMLQNVWLSANEKREKMDLGPLDYSNINTVNPILLHPDYDEMPTL